MSGPGRRLRAVVRPAVVALAAALLLGGCRFDGVGSLPLPLREGTGDGSYSLTVELEQVANLVPNAEVKVDDVTVGAVTSVDVVDWHAALTVGLNPGVVLPANAEARIGQKSLLGAEYLELAPPASGRPTGRLRDGDVIPLARTGRYPETEEVLAALSVVLNGGGLQQVRTITTELDDVLDGREGDLRALVGNLDTLVGTLDRQRGDIVRAVESLDRFAGTVNRDRDVLARGIETIPPGLRVLADDREKLVDTLERVGTFGDVAVRVLNRSRDDLLANLHQLRPALRRLADSGSNLTESLPSVLTFPFPATTAFPRMLNGDYGNLFATFDLTPAVLAKLFLGGATIPGAPGLLSAPPLGAGTAVLPPFAAFLAPAPTAARPAPVVVLPTPGGGVPRLPALPALPASPLPGAAPQRSPGTPLDGLLGGSR